MICFSVFFDAPSRSVSPLSPGGRGEQSSSVPAARFLVGAAGWQIFSPLACRFRVARETLASSFRSLEKQKGSGTPVDADPYPPHPAVRLCLPLRKQLACRRSTRGSRPRDFRPQGSASGHASWDAAGAYDPKGRPSGRVAHAAPRALPAPRLSQSSEAPHTPVVVPAG